MAERWDLAEALGLDLAAVRGVAWLGVRRVTEAMAPWEDPIDPDAFREPPPAHLVDYACDHGFRAIGQIALLDQDLARDLADRLGRWLRSAESWQWPLSLAVAHMPYPFDELADELNAAPFSAARELSRCLVPSYLSGSAVPRAPGTRASRTGLSPYGIDLELLRLIVLGRTPGDDASPVSDISMPSLVHTLFRAIERTLMEQREDAYHWSAGLSVIQPTDPEVLIVVRACLLSERARSHVIELPPDLPMARALVALESFMASG